MKVCTKCGAVVANTERHDNYHFWRQERTDLSEVNLPVRMFNTLRRYGISDLETLLAFMDEYADGRAAFVYDLRNVGAKTAERGLYEIEEYLKANPFYEEVPS